MYIQWRHFAVFTYKFIYTIVFMHLTLQHFIYQDHNKKSYLISTDEEKTIKTGIAFDFLDGNEIVIK